MQIQLTQQEVIEEMTRPLVEFYRPARIYLLGSEARGDCGAGQRSGFSGDGA